MALLRDLLQAPVGIDELFPPPVDLAMEPEPPPPGEAWGEPQPYDPLFDPTTGGYVDPALEPPPPPVMVNKTQEPAGGEPLPSVMGVPEQPDPNVMRDPGAFPTTPFGPIELPDLPRIPQYIQEQGLQRFGSDVMKGVLNVDPNMPFNERQLGRGLAEAGTQLLDPMLGAVASAGIKAGAKVAGEAVGGALVRAGEQVFGAAPPRPVALGRSPSVAAPPPPPVPQANPQNVLGLREAEAGLPAYERAANRIRASLGRPQTHGVASPIMEEGKRIYRTVENEANLLAAEAGERVDNAFTFENGLLPDLADENFPNGPGIRDVAARLPEFWDRLTPAQQETMEWLRNQVKPFRDLRDSVFADTKAITGNKVGEIGTRGDIIEGGFYLPRGRAGLEGVDEPVQVFTGGRGGGSRGYKKAATLESEAQGVETGHVYPTLKESLQTYVNSIGREIGDRHKANAFLQLKQDGVRVAQRAVDRVNPELRKAVQDLTASIAGQRITSIRQKARMGALGQVAQRTGRWADQAERLTDRAWQRLVQRINDAPSDVLLEDASKQLHQLRREALKALRAEGAASGAARRAPGISEAMKGFADIQRVGDSLVEAARKKVDVGTAAGQQAINDLQRRLRPFERLRDAAAKRFDAAIEKAAKLNDVAERTAAESSAAMKAWKDQERITAQIAKSLAHDSELSAMANREFSILLKESGKDATRASREATRAGLQAGKWQATLDALDEKQARLFDLRGKLKTAMHRASSIPRDRGAIDMAELQGYDFPLEIANAANMVIKDEARSRQEGIAKAVMGLWRSTTATLDNSAIMIQGALGWVNNPSASAKALATNLKAFADENAFGAYVKRFNEQATKEGLPDAMEWARHNLRVAGPGQELRPGAGMSQKASETFRNLPGIKQADRMFTAYTDTLRLQWAQDEARTMVKSVGRSLNQQELDAIAESINRFTGYVPEAAGGGIGNLLLYSTRYTQAKLETLATALTPSNAIQNQMARSALIKTLGFTGAVTFAANAAQGRDTDIRPLIPDGHGGMKRNPQFMTVRWNDQDWTIFGQPFTSIFGMMLAAASGHPEQGARNLLSGLPAKALWDAFEGSTVRGQRVRDTPEQVIRYIAQAFTPFGAGQVAPTVSQIPGELQQGDVLAAARDLGSAALQISGVSASPMSYSDIQAMAVADVVKAKGYPANTTYDDLAPEDRRAVNEDPRLQAELKKLEPEPLTDRQVVSDAIARAAGKRERLQQELSDRVAAGATGAVLREYVQQFKRDSFTASDTEFGDPKVIAALDRVKRKEGILPQRAIIAQRYWDVPLELKDDQTPDFKRQAAARDAVLKEAAALGVSEDYITGRGKDSFRPDYTNPKVSALIEQYEADMKVLKPYWETRTVLLAIDPRAREDQRLAEAALAKGDQRTANSYLAYVNDKVGRQHALYLKSHPEAVAALDRWGYKHPAVPKPVDWSRWQR